MPRCEGVGEATPELESLSASFAKAGLMADAVAR